VLYAVLDCARDPRMRRWACDSSGPRWCLFRGQLDPELEDAAPHLLKLIPGQPYVDQFFLRGWGRAWGFVFSSPAPSKELRRHLRRFLRVRTQRGDILLFRYYDPRVLRVYLPTCTPKEIATFFGPITAMAVESKQAGKFQIFQPSASGVQAASFDYPLQEARPQRRTG